MVAGELIWVDEQGMQEGLSRWLSWFVISLMCGFIAFGLYAALKWMFWTRSGSDLEQSMVRAAVVLTGDNRRIRFALNQMEQGRFDRLLIVGAGLDPGRFEQQFVLSERLRQSVERGEIELADRSTSTLENAIEAFCWLRRHSSISSITLITSQSHMARASLAFDRALGPYVRVSRLVSDEREVAGRPVAHTTEWHKFLATWFITLAPQSLWVTGSIEPCTRLGGWMALGA